MTAPPFDGSRDPADIRTFYTSEVAYLRAMQRRYACQFCGASSCECPGCRDLRLRIEKLEAEKSERTVARERAVVSESTVVAERAAALETTGVEERAERGESTEEAERAERWKGTVVAERAEPTESTGCLERDDSGESAVTRERAEPEESTEHPERVMRRRVSISDVQHMTALILRGDRPPEIPPVDPGKSVTW